jgi:hypothetical protein
MNVLEKPRRRVRLKNHSLVCLAHFPTPNYISCHSAPLLPTLCPDCSLVLFHVKRNVSQNENYFCARRFKITRARSFLKVKTTISGGAVRGQLRRLVVLWPKQGDIVL